MNDWLTIQVHENLWIELRISFTNEMWVLIVFTSHNNDAVELDSIRNIDTDMNVQNTFKHLVKKWSK